jgi:excisionase family DNA binding protein/PAS domain S-box-containing protein
MPEKRLLSTKEACDYLGVSRMTLLEAEAKGLLQAERTVGGHRRYTRAALEAFLQSTRAAHEERQFVSPAQRTFVLPQFIAQLGTQQHAPDEILTEALRSLVVLLQADIGAVFTLDQCGELHLRASFGVPHWALKDLAALSPQGTSAEVVQRRQVVVYAADNSELPLRLESGQGICAPLIYHDQVLGVVHVISLHRHQFFPSEINIAATIAVYLASLTINWQLLGQQQVLLKELSLLNQISAAMETRTELDPLLQTFLDQTIAVMQADAGCVFLRDPLEKRLYVRVATGYPEAIRQFSVSEGMGIVGWVVEHGEPHFSPSLTHDPMFTRRAAFLTGKIIANLCLPLRSAGETFGAFHISTHSPRTFTPDEIRFLNTVGNQAAVIIRRAMMWDAVTRQAQAELERSDSYQVVIESLPIGMVVVGPDLKIALWNGAIERMTGVPRVEAIGRSPREAFAPMEKGWQLLEEAMRTRQGRCVASFRHAIPGQHSAPGQCEARIIPLQQSGGTAAVMFVYEITPEADPGSAALADLLNDGRLAPQ